MSLPKYKELKSLNTIEEIQQEIFLLEKNLFDLRMKRAAQQQIKPHFFIHYKRRISQLNFKKRSLIK
jgi:ribosomal protein L29